MEHADTSDLRRREIEGSAHINTAEGHQNKVTVTSSLNLASTCSCVLHLLCHTSPLNRVILA